MTIRERLSAGFLRLAKRASPDNPSTSFYEWLENYGGGESESGVNVSPDSAMRVMAFFACVRILAESLASLPIHMYERRGDGIGRDRTTDHPVSDLVRNEPNELMSAYIWKETLQGHVAARGNCFSYLRWDRSGGTLAAIHPIPPTVITPELNEAGRLVYRLQPGYEIDEKTTLLPYEVLHVPGLGFDGIVGYSPVTLAREALGLSLATEKAGAALFGKGGRPSGILSTEQNLQEDQVKILKRMWDASQGGVDNMGKTAVLSGGLKWQQVTIDPRDMQFLDTRKFQTQEIARLFRIPPHMLADLDRATFSNIEHQDLAFVKHTLRPWLVRWEGELNRKLLTANERERFFLEFNVEAMLRGDTKSRHDAYQSAVLTGWMNRNEIRARENLNPGPDELDEFLEPQNMRGADDDAEPEPTDEPTPPEPDEGDEELEEAV